MMKFWSELEPSKETKVVAILKDVNDLLSKDSIKNDQTIVRDILEHAFKHGESSEYWQPLLELLQPSYQIDLAKAVLSKLNEVGGDEVPTIDHNLLLRFAQILVSSIQALSIEGKFSFHFIIG